MASIGIDLGTTNSCVAAAINGEVQVIANNTDGRRTVASCVEFMDDDNLVGNAAKNHIQRNLENTIFGVKRLIGRSYQDQHMAEDLDRFKFRVNEVEGKPAIKVKCKGVDKTLFPEDISSMVLAEMKRIAEVYIGGKVFNAVITIPAYFNAQQRKATEIAAKKANLEVIDIINEPTAAALAFGTQRKSSSQRKVLVYDLGGGTFDVSILTIRNDEFEVEATGGNPRLGGDDFNQRLFEYFSAKFKEKHGKDVAKSKSQSEWRLREECEKIKIGLSTATKETCTIDNLLDGIDFDCPIERSDFVDINRSYFDETFTIVKDTMASAKVEKKEITEVLLVGGSTRIPYVQERLETMFGKEKIKREINPDESVAYGAAVRAMGNLTIRERTPLSLGVGVIGDVMSVIIKRNATIPTRQTKRYTTVDDDQTEIDFEVYQGERADIKHNEKLGTFPVRGIEPMKAGGPDVEVVFEMQSDGLLNATARGPGFGVQNITIRIDENCIPDKDKKIIDSERNRMNDERWKQRIEVINKLRFLAIELKRETPHVEVRVKCNEMLDWISANKDASSAEATTKIAELDTLNKTSCTQKLRTRKPLAPSQVKSKVPVELVARSGENMAREAPSTSVTEEPKPKKNGSSACIIS